MLDSEYEQCISENGETHKSEQPSKQDGDVRGLLTHKKEELDRSRREESQQLMAEVRYNKAFTHMIMSSCCKLSEVVSLED